MGTYLSTPVLDKCWEEGEDYDNSTPVAWGVVDMQGWRKTMEDAHIAQTDVTLPNSTDSRMKIKSNNNNEDNNEDKNDKNQQSNAEEEQQKESNDVAVDHAQVFAVFDGHGGAEVARFCQLYLVDVLTHQKEWMGKNGTDVDVGKALINCFHAMDDLLRDPKRREEIHELRTIKPHFTERRSLIDSSISTSISTVQSDDNEEKKMEENNTVSNLCNNNSNESPVSNGSSDESADTDDNIEVIGDIHEVESTVNDAVAEDEVISSTDAVSLFSRLLHISNDDSGITSNSDEQNRTDGNPDTITPTLYQNGRPICNLPDHPVHAGCTSVCAVINGRTLTVANAGDSRVVLCREGGVTEPMTFDHKPMQEIELKRISEAGGFVNQFGRVNGNLNLSRSIGDLKYKQLSHIPPAGQMITAEPDIKQVELQDNDEFIILACDGIWDCLTNEEAVKFVRERIDIKTPTDIGVEMLDEIVSKDPRETQGIGGDNMTVMIVDLQPLKRPYRDSSNNTPETKVTE